MRSRKKDEKWHDKFHDMIASCLHHVHNLRALMKIVAKWVWHWLGLWQRRYDPSSGPELPTATECCYAQQQSANRGYLHLLVSDAPTRL